MVGSSLDEAAGRTPSNCSNGFNGFRGFCQTQIPGDSLLRLLFASFVLANDSFPPLVDQPWILKKNSTRDQIGQYPKQKVHSGKDRTIAMKDIRDNSRT